MKQLIVMLLLVSGLLGGVFISKPFESSTAHMLAAYLAEGAEISEGGISRHEILDISGNTLVEDVWRSVQKLWGSRPKKPDYCKEILQEAVHLDDALKSLEEPGAIYCPGFDYTTNACGQQQQAIKQAIKLCFTTSYYHTKPDQTLST